mmetsp:Transcript_24392/g.70545  ORF Transcript_24392/g.70545 Transcript_24392/m.70545 type:complete len:304 (+) Transcript_24392:954-1865(+)
MKSVKTAVAFAASASSLATSATSLLCSSVNFSKLNFCMLYLHCRNLQVFPFSTTLANSAASSFVSFLSCSYVSPFVFLQCSICSLPRFSAASFRRWTTALIFSILWRASTERAPTCSTFFLSAKRTSAPARAVTSFMWSVRHWFTSFSRAAINWSRLRSKRSPKLRSSAAPSSLSSTSSPFDMNSVRLSAAPLTCLSDSSTLAATPLATLLWSSFRTLSSCFLSMVGNSWRSFRSAANASSASFVYSPMLFSPWSQALNANAAMPAGSSPLEMAPFARASGAMAAPDSGCERNVQSVSAPTLL